jgi:hypothetical protein
MKPNTGLPSELSDCGDLDHKGELISPHLHLLIFVNCKIICIAKCNREIRFMWFKYYFLISMATSLVLFMTRKPQIL